MKAKKILIFRFGALGDVIHTTELFRSIKRKYPKFKIHYLTFKAPSLLLKNDPDLEKIWILENKAYKDIVNKATDLRKEKFDVCINLQPSIRTSVFCFLINAKKTLTYKKDFNLHAVENFWRTATPTFKSINIEKNIKIYIDKQDSGFINEILKANSDKKIVCFNMGATNARQGRKWDLESWKELSVELKKRYNCQIVINGSSEDKKLADKLLAFDNKIKSFCGKLTLNQSTALLAQSNIVISGDTGPLHIASATSTTVIGLYGAAPINRSGPYSTKAISIKSALNCSPCNKRKCKFLKKGETVTPCMKDIKAEQVIKAIDDKKLL